MRHVHGAVLAAGLALLGGSVLAQSLDAGIKAYQECVACHAVERGVNGVGPSLVGIVGSKAGEVDGFRSSGPMKRSGIVWTPENLDKFLANPQSVIPGTRMPYSGMRSEKTRAELIRYLASLV